MLFILKQVSDIRANEPSQTVAWPKDFLVGILWVKFLARRLFVIPNLKLNYNLSFEWRQMTGFSLHLSLLHAVRPLWYAMSRHVLRWNTNVTQTLLMCMHWLLPVLSSFKSEISTMLWAHAKSLALFLVEYVWQNAQRMIGVKVNGWSAGNHQFDPYPSDSLLPILGISPPQAP
jgi:hypothetical protein